MGLCNAYAAVHEGKCTGQVDYWSDKYGEERDDEAYGILGKIARRVIEEELPIEGMFVRLFDKSCSAVKDSVYLTRDELLRFRNTFG